MPWTSQQGGGGPWGTPPGGGGKNPWNRPTGGTPPGPDLDAMFRRFQDRLRRLLPGGFGSGRGIVLIVLGLIAIWFASGFYRVQANEQGVVLRFGRWVRTEQPGLHYHLPAPIETVLLPEVTRVNRTEIGYRSPDQSQGTAGTPSIPDESLMLTGDENIIDINFSVFWVIKNAGDYLFNVRDPANTVKKAAESAMREVIGRTNIQPALTEARAQIEQSTRTLLQKMLDDYGAGIDVTQVQLQKVDPPGPVVDAFNDVQRARSDRDRMRNEAEAYSNGVIPRARGDAARIVQEATAYREQVMDRAEGDAKRFLSVLGAYRQAPGVLGERLYLETIEQVLQHARKIVLDRQAATGVVPYLPLAPAIQGGGAAGKDAAPAPAPQVPPPPSDNTAPAAPSAPQSQTVN